MTQEHKHRTLHREQFGNTWVDVKLIELRTQKLDNGCWEYTGPRHPQGYGMITTVDADTLNFGMSTTHRVAMKIKLKCELGRHDYVLHKCDNFACINPDHLYIGDHSEMSGKRKPFKWKNRKKTLKK